MLVALGIVAVALGSALFPPTGLGSAPASETDLVGPRDAAPGSGPGSGSSDSTVSGDGKTVAAGDGATAEPGDSEPGGGTSDATRTDGPARGSSTPAVTVTPTPSPTPTPTPNVTEAAFDDDSGSGLGLLGLVGGLILSFVVTVALVAVVRLLQALRESGAAGGSAQSLGLFGGIGRLFDGSPVGIVARIPQATMVALVGVSTGTARLLGGAGSLASEVVGGLAFVVGAGSRSVTAGLGSGLSGLFSLPGPPTISFSGLFSGLRRGGSGTATADSPTADARTATSLDPESTGEDRIRTVEDAWEAFADPLPAEHPEARTPGEFARLAVEHGDPTGAVRRLTRAFRDVRYGGRPPSDDRTRSALVAVSDILDDRDREDDR